MKRWAVHFSCGTEYLAATANLEDKAGDIRARTMAPPLVVARGVAHREGGRLVRGYVDPRHLP